MKAKTIGLVTFVFCTLVGSILISLYLVMPNERSYSERFELIATILVVLLVISFAGLVVTGIYSTKHILKEGSKYRTISIRIPLDTYRRLEKKGEDQGKSLEELIINTLDYYTENQ